MSFQLFFLIISACFFAESTRLSAMTQEADIAAQQQMSAQLMPQPMAQRALPDVAVPPAAGIKQEVTPVAVRRTHLPDVEAQTGKETANEVLKYAQTEFEKQAALIKQMHAKLAAIEASKAPSPVVAPATTPAAVAVEPAVPAKQENGTKKPKMTRKIVLSASDVRMEEKKIEQLKSLDVVTKIGGRIREDYWYYYRPLALRSDLNDEYHYMRNKIEVKIQGVQGLQTYGQPASDFSIKMSTYNFWGIGQHRIYDKLISEPVFARDLDGAKVADKHNHEQLTPPVYLEEGWFNIHFGTFAKFLKKHPISFKMGYFPYWLGRGMSLGTHGDLALTYGGFIGFGDQFRFPFMPPGILIRGEFSKELTWDFYFNKWRGSTALPDGVWDPSTALINKNRLAAPGPERGPLRDRETWAFRFDFTKKHSKTGIFYAQPYFAYSRIPEMSVELSHPGGDAKAKLGTVGCMLDYKYKGWEFNVEVAGQFGHQQMHCIDRNVVQLRRDKGTGNVQEVFSHIYSIPVGTDGIPDIPATVLSPDPAISTPVTVPVAAFAANSFARVGEFVASKAQVTRFPSSSTTGEDLLTIANLPANRPGVGFVGKTDCPIKCPSRAEVLSANGRQLVSRTGTPINIPSGAFVAQSVKLYNGNTYKSQPLGALPRFRPGYKLKYQGVMGMADIAYTFPKLPIKLAISWGYLSGDPFPYNEECDKTLKNFIAQRAAYESPNVGSVLVFQELVLPRPLNINYKTFMATNNFRDYSNLQWFGASLRWFPLKDRKQLMIKPNAVAFWEVAKIFKWDENGKHPDEIAEFIIELSRQRFGFKGWEGNCEASKFVGVETLLEVDYYIQKNCLFYFRGFMFFPGQIYTDLKGQPNEFGARANPKNVVDFKFNDLGNKMIWGLYTGFDYKF